MSSPPHAVSSLNLLYKRHCHLSPAQLFRMISRGLAFRAQGQPCEHTDGLGHSRIAPLPSPRFTLSLPRAPLPWPPLPLVP